MEEEKLLESQGFYVIKKAGHGSFGSVFQVHHPAIGVVAAKVMKNEFFDENEWNIAGIFQSDPPHICPFIIRNILARKFEEMTVILLENANMDNLQKLIEANVDIPLATVRVIMKQLFEGLRYIHFKGIIHRDIKPANILLHSPPDSGRVLCKIGDFGEVKIKSGDNKLTLMTFRGTAVYMAPELFLGDRHEQKQADNTVDIWSLGIVLYQIMTHTFPFDTSTQPAILSFMTTKVLARPHQILDDNLWDLLMRMLSFDRENRISAEDALKHPFFTSEKALSEITEEQRQLALITQQNIDKNVSYFDINPSFILTLNEVQRILGKVDLGAEITQIQEKIALHQQQQQKIKHPTPRIPSPPAIIPALNQHFNSNLFVSPFESQLQQDHYQSNNLQRQQHEQQHIHYHQPINEQITFQDQKQIHNAFFQGANFFGSYHQLKLNKQKHQSHSPISDQHFIPIQPNLDQQYSPILHPQQIMNIPSPNHLLQQQQYYNQPYLQNPLYQNIINNSNNIRYIYPILSSSPTPIQPLINSPIHINIIRQPSPINIQPAISILPPQPELPPIPTHNLQQSNIINNQTNNNYSHSSSPHPIHYHSHLQIPSNSSIAVSQLQNKNQPTLNQSSSNSSNSYHRNRSSSTPLPSQFITSPSSKQPIPPPPRFPIKFQSNGYFNQQIHPSNSSSPMNGDKPSFQNKIKTFFSDQFNKIEKIINRSQDNQLLKEDNNDQEEDLEQKIPCDLCKQLIRFSMYQQHAIMHQQLDLNKRNKKQQENRAQDQKRKIIEKQQQLKQEENDKQFAIQLRVQEQRKILDSLLQLDDYLIREEEKQVRVHIKQQEQYTLKLQTEQNENIRNDIQKQIKVEQDMFEIQKERIQQERARIRQQTEMILPERQYQGRNDSEKENEIEKQNQEWEKIDQETQKEKEQGMIDQIKCSFCQKMFLKNEALNHAKLCTKDDLSQNILLNRAQYILFQMEKIADGQYKTKEGQIIVCPFCYQNHPLIENHIQTNHHNQFDLFQNTLQFIYEINKQ